MIRLASAGQLGRPVPAAFGLLVLLLAGHLSLPRPAAAAESRPGARDVLSAVVGVHVEAVADGRTVESLGRERTGTGVVIDSGGLVLTIGYLVVEAAEVEIRTHDGHGIPAEVVGYDHDSGFGLLRASAPLAVTPARLGDSSRLEIDQPVLAVSQVGGLAGIQAKVVDRREFAGYWEYLLEDAIFTTPPLPQFGGAALLDGEGRLVGIGSLLVPEAAGTGIASPGNMFVPVDALKPILGDLLALGRRDGPARPWLGITVHELNGRIVVADVADDGPADKAGLVAGDIILSVGAGSVAGLADLYRKLWASGPSGTAVQLGVLHQGGIRSLSVASTDRLRWLKLQQSF